MTNLLVESEGTIETWTMNLPDQRNPVTGEGMVSAIENAVARVNADSGVRCVIITGAGTAFSSGGNIKDIADGVGYFGAEPYAQSNGYRNGVQRIPRALYACDVPVIAAVNGPAVGAGFDLALMCDLRVASTTAFFAESFVKLGLIPGDGGAWFLPRVIGQARAAEMTLTGDRIGADTALEWGLVSQVVSPDELAATARRLAERVSANPPHAVRMAKRLLRESQHQSLASLLELSSTMQALAHHTSDHTEAISAIMTKREPRFTGE